MSFLKSIKANKALLIALMLGLLLRGLNPTFGSPALYVSNDEAIAHQSALNMLAAKTPFSLASYTPLNAYLQIPFIVLYYLVANIFGTFNSLSEFEYFLLTHEGYLLFIPRVLSALLGTLTIIVIYKISRIMFKSKNVAIISAFLTAFSFNLVHISHFGKPWAGALFFFALSTLYFLKKRIGFTTLFGVFSFGFHQIGIFSLPYVLFSHASSARKKLVFCALWLILTFFFQFLSTDANTSKEIVTGYSFFKPDTVVTDLLANKISFNSLLLTVKNNSFLYIFENLLVTDGVIFIFAIAGFFLLFRESSNKPYLGFALFQILVTMFFFFPIVRYYFLFLILIIPIASYAIYQIGRNIKLLVFPYSILLSFFLMLNPLWWNYLFMKEPTFLQVSRWIDLNLPQSKWLVYTGGRYQTFAPSLEASEIVRKYDPLFYSRLSQSAKISSNLYTKNIIYLGRIPGDGKRGEFEGLSNKFHVDYVIDYYMNWDDRLYNKIPDKFEVVQQFTYFNNSQRVNPPAGQYDASLYFQAFNEDIEASMFHMSRFGPNFDVLKVK